MFVCRARQKAGLSLDIPLPYWAEKAYLTGNGVFSQIQSEMDEGDDGDTAPAGRNLQIKGKGDSDAFALIAEHLKEQDGR